MAPDLSTYQQAAQSIYEPQKAAEAASLNTAKTNTVAELESTKGQVQSNYQTAIDSLNSTLKSGIAKINQMYTERLGGNFSGLQGNDVGGLLSTGAKQLSAIESTRANALNEIAVKEAGAENTYSTDLAGLTGKYQSLENKYALDTFAAASKQASTDAYRQAQLGLSEQRLAISQEKANTTAASQVKVKQGSQGQYMFSDKNGEPISMSQFISQSGKSGQDIINLLGNGTDYDKNVLKQISSDPAGKQAIQNEDAQALQKVIAKYDKNNYYGFGG